MPEAPLNRSWYNIICPCTASDDVAMLLDTTTQMDYMLLCSASGSKHSPKGP